MWRGAEKLLLIGQHVIKKARNNVEYHSIKSLGGRKRQKSKEKCDNKQKKTRRDRELGDNKALKQNLIITFQNLRDKKTKTILQPSFKTGLNIQPRSCYIFLGIVSCLPQERKPNPF